MKKCPVTNKKSQVGGSYSNRKRAMQFNPCGKRRRQPNLHKKTIFVPEINKSVRVEISTNAIKTINKNGPYVVLKKAGLI